MGQILAVVEEVCFGEVRVAFLQGTSNSWPWGAGTQLPQTQHTRTPQVHICHGLMPQPQSKNKGVIRAALSI